MDSRGPVAVAAVRRRTVALWPWVTPLFRKTRLGHYAAFGPAQSGRLLVIVFEKKSGGLVLQITGWDMDAAERRYYQRQTAAPHFVNRDHVGQLLHR